MAKSNAKRESVIARYKILTRFYRTFVCQKPSWYWPIFFIKHVSLFNWNGRHSI